MYKILKCFNNCKGKGTVKIHKIQWSDYRPYYGGLLFCTYENQEYVFEIVVNAKNGKLSAVKMISKETNYGDGIVHSYSRADKNYNFRPRFQYEDWIDMMSALFKEARNFDVSNVKESYFGF